VGVRGRGVTWVWLVAACGGPTSKPEAGPTPGSVPTPIQTAPVTSVASIPSASAPSVPATAGIVAAPKPVEPCAVSAPRLAVESKRVRGFDVGRDGRLYWSVGSDPTVVYSLDAATLDGEPRLELKTDGFAHSTGEMVAGRKGFWFESHNPNNHALCQDRLTWAPRGGGRVVPLGAPSCLDGPRPARGDVDAVWTTSRSYGGAKRFFLGTGPARPASVKAVTGVIDPDLEGYLHAADATYVGYDNAVFRKGPEQSPNDAKAISRFYGGSLSSNQVVSIDRRDDHVFAVVRQDFRRYHVFDVPVEGKRREIALLETRSGTARLRAGDGFVALAIHGVGKKEPPQLVLLDTAGACPPHDLKPMKLASSPFRVHGHHLFVDRDEGIEVVRWGAP